MLPGKQITSFFYVRNALGIITPDALPTCVLIRNGIDTVVSVTVSTASDGSYKAQSLIPSDWLEGDIVHLRIAALKNGLAVANTNKLGEVELPASPAAPTVSQTATAVRTELTIELGRIDRAVSSVFTSGDRAVLSAIPTNTYTSALSSIQSSISALPTLAAIEGSIVLFKINNYTAPDNAGIGSLNSKLTTIRTDGLDRLPNLDALITSRATPDQVWAVPYSGLTQTGTIGRLLYWIGKLFGATSTSVTASVDARTTGDGTISQTITTNPDGSKTMSGNP